jgi:hypothetical protein
MCGNTAFNLADDKYDENEDKDNDQDDLGEDCMIKKVLTQRGLVSK